MAGVSGKPIEIRVSQPQDSDEPTFPPYDGPAFLSYGFRPFFLSAALFAALAVPAWILIVTGAVGANFIYAPREWHVHEMLFGFLPAAMAGKLFKGPRRVNAPAGRATNNQNQGTVRRICAAWRQAR